VRTTRQLSITLPNDMADALRDRVRKGEYASESEVVREGLRALRYSYQVARREPLQCAQATAVGRQRIATIKTFAKRALTLCSRLAGRAPVGLQPRHGQPATP
jgi:putative addiction module CopG family antidote